MIPNPPRPTHRGRNALFVILGLVLLAAFIGALSRVGTPTRTTPAPALSTATATAAVTTPPALPAATPEPAPVAPEPAPVPAGPAREMSDGTYEVGVDVAPGKYKTVADELCYWSRLKHNDGSLGDIIQNDLGGGPKTVTVRKGEYFTTQRCGTWKTA